MPLPTLSPHPLYPHPLSPLLPPRTLSQVFLQPGAWGRYKGLPVRKDLGELMEATNQQGLRLSALRLGGSMVLCPGYRWKSFRGDPEHRQPYAGVWYVSAAATIDIPCQSS